MRKLLLALAVLAASAIAVPLGFSSSHREAPGISLDPSADNTDTYAWTAKDAPGALTIAADWIPGEVPANGPNFHSFDDRARYYVHIDNTGDGRPDVSYRFRFKTKVRNKESFLYALPGASGYSDPKLNVIQRYSIDRVTYRGKSRKEHVTTIARGLPVAPPNIGPKTFPNYDTFVSGAIRSLNDGTIVFAGQRDDPFFVDLGATFDGLNVRKLTGNQGEGKDDLSGYNVHSTVLQIPERLVTRNHQAVAGADAANAVVGVWSTTERRRLQVSGSRASHGGWVQVSRLGNPLVNEVVIPVGKKDQFNRTTPDRDAELYGGFVVKPELAAVLNLLFNVGAPETNRLDIVQAVLQGLPGLNQQGKNPKPVDTIKLNLGVPPAASPNPLGALGGDLAGYPNGRRLTDDVVDIAIQVVAGELADPTVLGADACKAPAKCPNPTDLGDGVPGNDKAFSDKFPYLAEPNSGLESRIKKDYATP